MNGDVNHMTTIVVEIKLPGRELDGRIKAGNAMQLALLAKDPVSEPSENDPYNDNKSDREIDRWIIRLGIDRAFAALDRLTKPAVVAAE